MDPDAIRDSAPPGSFDQFMASLRDPETIAPVIPARRFAAVLHIDMQSARFWYRNEPCPHSTTRQPNNAYQKDAPKTCCTTSPL